MKLFMVLLLLTSTAFADSDRALTCYTEVNAGSLSINSLRTQSQGSLSYIYTTARIVCPNYLNHYIDRNESFRCAGLWDFDNHLPGEVYGEPLTVEFKHDGEKYVANFSASKVHQNRKITMNCSLQ